jgi:cytochrome b561
MAKALGLIGGTFIGATLLKFILATAGIITFDYTFAMPSSLLTTSRLLPSFSVAIKEALDMHGAYIFNKVLDYHNLAIFVNFGLMLAGLVSFGLIISKANQSFRKQKGLTDETNFVAAVMTISFFVTFLVFATSGYAIANLSNGQIVSAENARYISILPLITVIAFVWLLKNYYAKHIALVCLICVVLVGGIIGSHSTVKATYASGSAKLEISPSRDSINQIITHLKNNDVTEASVDYWYAGVLRFWANDTIAIAPVVDCSEAVLNDPSNLFTKQDHNTALIIDRGERNYGFWKCTDAQLIEVYGTPSETYEVAGAGPNEPVKIWVYKNAQ